MHIVSVKLTAYLQHFIQLGDCRDAINRVSTEGKYAFCFTHYKHINILWTTGIDARAMVPPPRWQAAMQLAVMWLLW